MSQQKKKRRNLGFTLVEMLLVMTIIGLLATVVVINFSGMSGEARINATRSSITSIKTAVQTYEIRTGKMPKSIDDLTVELNGQPPILDKAQLNDSWGVPFQFKFSGNTFEIRSAGPDGTFGNEDDVTN